MATQKQLAARRLFAKRARAGTLKKGTRKRKAVSKSKIRVKPRRTVKSMAKRKTYRRRSSSGLKIGKPMVKGAVAGVIIGVGTSYLANQVMPGNKLVSYGGALVTGGFPGLVGAFASDVVACGNPLAALSGGAQRASSTYGAGGY